jgi:hypothetical protein
MSDDLRNRLEITVEWLIDGVGMDDYWSTDDEIAAIRDAIVEIEKSDEFILLEMALKDDEITRLREQVAVLTTGRDKCAPRCALDDVLHVEKP